MSGFFEKLFAGKWIAGPDVADAIAEAERLNRLGIAAIINYLGEAYHRKEVVDNAVGTYLSLIAEIRRRKLRADISMKITELGYLIDKKTAFSNYSRIVDLAAKNKIFVWLDMEEHRFVDDTIRIYLSKMKKGNTGICIQSYLRRSMRDVGKLPNGATIRLVKGAYSESEDIAFQTRKSTTENYAVLMYYIWNKFDRFTIATHDKELLQIAFGLEKRQKREVTYAMLKGVRNKYAAELAKSGKRVAVYVPFGREWMPYSLRRLREASNLKLIVRSVFGG